MMVVIKFTLVVSWWPIYLLHCSKKKALVLIWRRLCLGNKEGAKFSFRGMASLSFWFVSLSLVTSHFWSCHDTELTHSVCIKDPLESCELVMMEYKWDLETNFLVWLGFKSHLYSITSSYLVKNIEKWKIYSGCLILWRISSKLYFPLPLRIRNW